MMKLGVEREKNDDSWEIGNDTVCRKRHLIVAPQTSKASEVRSTWHRLVKSRQRNLTLSINPACLSARFKTPLLWSIFVTSLSSPTSTTVKLPSSTASSSNLAPSAQTKRKPKSSASWTRWTWKRRRASLSGPRTQRSSTKITTSTSSIPRDTLTSVVRSSAS